MRRDVQVFGESIVVEVGSEVYEQSEKCVQQRSIHKYLFATTPTVGNVSSRWPYDYIENRHKR